MASLRKRGNKWQVQIRREGFPALTKTFRLREDAARWAREQDRLVDLGEGVVKRPPHGQTLADLLRRYASEITTRKRSAVSERFHLRIIERHAIARLGPANLAPSHLCQFRDDRLRQVSASTVRKEMGILQRVLKLARHEWGVPIKADALKPVATPPACRPRERRVRQDELLALDDALQQCRNPLVQQVFLFALATGMRRGEVLSLIWSNVDPANATAHLPLTKNGHPRTVPLSPSALAALPTRTAETGPDDRVFPLSANALRLAWERVKRRAGIEDLHFHDLRHEAISRFFEMGLSVPEVSLISGHRDARMLFRYTHLRAEDVASKLHRLAESGEATRD